MSGAARGAGGSEVMDSLFTAARLPEGERSWWRYLKRVWDAEAAAVGVGFTMTKREAKLAAYPGRKYRNKKRRRHGR